MALTLRDPGKSPVLSVTIPFSGRRGFSFQPRGCVFGRAPGGTAAEARGVLAALHPAETWSVSPTPSTRLSLGPQLHLRGPRAWCLAMPRPSGWSPSQPPGRGPCRPASPVIHVARAFPENTTVKQAFQPCSYQGHKQRPLRGRWGAGRDGESWPCP